MDPIRPETMSNYSNILSSTFTSLQRQEDESCNKGGLIIHSMEQQVRKNHSLQAHHPVNVIVEEGHNSNEAPNHPLPFPTNSSFNPTLKHKATYSPFCSKLIHKPLHLHVLDASYSSSSSSFALLSPPSSVVGSTSARTPNSDMSPKTTTTHPPPSLFGNGYSLSRNNSSFSSMNSSISRNSSCKSISSVITTTPKNPKTKMLIGLDQIVQRSNSKAVKNALTIIQQACDDDMSTKSSTKDNACIMADRDDHDDDDDMVVGVVHHDNNNVNTIHNPTTPLPFQPQTQTQPQPPIRELEFLVQLAQADAYYRVIIQKYNGMDIVKNALQRFDSTTTTTTSHSEWVSTCQLLLEILQSSNHIGNSRTVVTRSHTAMSPTTTHTNATFS